MLKWLLNQYNIRYRIKKFKSVSIDLPVHYDNGLRFTIGNGRSWDDERRDIENKVDDCLTWLHKNIGPGANQTYVANYVESGSVALFFKDKTTKWCWTWTESEKEVRIYITYYFRNDSDAMRFKLRFG